MNLCDVLPRRVFRNPQARAGDGFEGHELPAASAKPPTEPPHRVLNIGLIDREDEPTRDAVDRVLGFLNEPRR